MKPSPEESPSSPAHVAFDWIDVLLILGVAYATALALVITGYRPTLSFVAPVIAPLAWGAISLRSRIWPRPLRVVKKRLTFTGLLATALLVGGFFIGAFGAFWLTTLPTEPEAVNERELTARASELAALEPQLAVIEGIEPAPDDVAIDAVGFDELVKELEKPPSDAAVQRLAAKLRAETVARHDEELRLDREHGLRVSAWMGLVGVAALALGAWIDGKRAVVSS